MTIKLLGVLKLSGLSLINLISYPLVIGITGGLFLAKRISFKDFLGKCGYIPLKNTGKKEFLWFHVSSAGEWNTGKIFAKRLREKSRIPLLITYFNGDLTSVLARDENFLSPECQAIFLPVENTPAFWIIHRHYRVRALMILETEIWPSMILTAHWLGKKIFLVNGVLFFKEARNFLWFKPLFTPVLRCFDHIFCVSEKSRDNFLILGVSEERISTWSNFKYDLFSRVKNLLHSEDKHNKKPLNSDSIHKFSRHLELFFHHQKSKKRKIIIFASFHEGEFIKILPKVKKFFMNEHYSTILAPRGIGPRSIHTLEKKIQDYGLPYIKRSELKEEGETLDVPANLILDSFGELSSIYSLVDLVIMGGTFVPVGGHNFLEAIFFNKKVFLGKFIYHYEDFVDNFKDHVRLTDDNKIVQDIDDFFLKKHKRLKNGFKKIQKFSGSSMEVADLINEKINFSSFYEKI